jgi:uncharacterized membrane protein YhaH (DUF805 family)
LGTFSEENTVGLLQGLFTLAVAVPQIALNTRRFHDVGKSGWWQLLFLIPLVGLVMWLAYMGSDGDEGENKYGPSPKARVSYA